MDVVADLIHEPGSWLPAPLPVSHGLAGARIPSWWKASRRPERFSREGSRLFFSLAAYLTGTRGGVARRSGRATRSAEEPCGSLTGARLVVGGGGADVAEDGAGVAFDGEVAEGDDPYGSAVVDDG